jgi:glycerol-3-phosphate responsive antiterminator
MNITEVIKKLDEYTTGDEYQRAIKEAVFLLNSQKITFDLLRKQIYSQKNIIHLHIDLLNDLSAEIDRLNQELLKKANEK